MSSRSSICFIQSCQLVRGSAYSCTPLTTVLRLYAVGILSTRSKKKSSIQFTQHNNILKTAGRSRVHTGRPLRQRDGSVKVSRVLKIEKPADSARVRPPALVKAADSEVLRRAGGRADLSLTGAAQSVSQTSLCTLPMRYPRASRQLCDTER